MQNSETFCIFVPISKDIKVQKDMTFLEFNIKFPTEKSIIDYFVKVRFPTQPYCIRCGSVKGEYINRMTKGSKLGTLVKKGK